MDKATLQYCKDLKAKEPFEGLVAHEPDGSSYKLLIIGRGENAFYQEGDHAIIFEIHIGSGLISKTSMRKWDNGKKLSDDEKTRIANRTAKYFRSKGVLNINIC